MDESQTKAIIYIVRGPGVSQAFKSMKELLSELEVHNIAHDDLTSDLLKQDAVRRVVGNKNFPIVFLDEKPVGDLEDLKRFVMGFKLGEQFVSAQDPPKLEDNDSWEEEPVTEEQRGAKVEPEADHVSLVESIEVPKRRASGPSISPRVSKGSIEDTAQNLNSIGQVGEFVEGKVREWVSWWHSTPPPTVDPQVVESINQGGETFTVVHTNWYNRQQVKILQFGDTEFKRFHPKVSEPKAVHKYSEIQKLGLQGDSICVVYFETGVGDPEYYETTERDKIAALFMEGAKKQGKHLPRMWID